MRAALLFVITVGLICGFYGCAHHTSLPVTQDFKSTVIEFRNLAPRGVAMSPDGNWIYAGGLNDLVIIDSKNTDSILRIPLPFSYTSFIIFSLDSRFAFIGGGEGDIKKKMLIPRTKIITRIDTKSLETTSFHLEEEMDCVGAAISTDGSKLFLGNMNGSLLTIIDTVRLEIVRKIGLEEGGSFGLATSPNGLLYVTHAFKGSMSVINPKDGKVVDIVRGIGKIPVGIAISDDGKWACVAHIGEAIVAVINTDTLAIAHRIDVGGLSPPNQELANPKKFWPDSRIYITPDSEWIITWSWYLGFVSLVDLKDRKTKSVIPVEDGTLDMTLTPSGKSIIVKDYANSKLTIWRRWAPWE